MLLYYKIKIYLTFADFSELLCAYTLKRWQFSSYKAFRIYNTLRKVLCLLLRWLCMTWKWLLNLRVLLGWLWWLLLRGAELKHRWHSSWEQNCPLSGCWWKRAPTKVPGNSCGRMKGKDILVAAPDVLATVAVIKPKPTLNKEKIKTMIKASTYVAKFTFVWAYGIAVANTRITWIRAISIYDKTWLVMNSVEVVGVGPIFHHTIFSILSEILNHHHYEENWSKINMSGGINSKAKTCFVSIKEANFQGYWS